jgi:NADH-quinone oxidoreductase subunit A
LPFSDYATGSARNLKVFETSDMYAEFTAILVFALLGVSFVVGGVVFGWFVRPRKPDPDKGAIYECGEPTIGASWIRYNSRFYTVALVYLLFDVEVVVLVPIALVLRELAGIGFGSVALIGLLVFLAVLVLGLAYEWFYGNLDWIGEKAAPASESTNPPAAAEEGTCGN